MLDLIVVSMVGLWTLAFIGLVCYCVAFIAKSFADEISKIL